MTAATFQATPAQAGPGAIVIGSDYIALGVVRSLGRRGIPVWVLRDLHVCAAVSRYARRCLPWPTGDTARLNALLELSAEHRLRGWALFPTDDEAAALVARHHDLLSARFRLTTPPWPVMQWAYDKRLTHVLATRLGIDQPWTTCPRDRDAVAALDCPYPVVLKPAVKSRVNELTLARAWPVANRQQLLERYDRACELVDPDLILIQELIPGGGEAQFSFAALCADGRPLAWVVARRARQYPIDFSRGSTFVETVEEPVFEEPSRRLLAAIGYSGMVELEFKRDPRAGRPKLLDINARSWGWHTLGAGAGVDFPFLSWQLAHGETVPESRGRPGVRWVRMITDIPAAAAEIRRGRLSLGAYLRSLRPPFQCAVLARDDLMPALAELPTLLHRSTSRASLWRRTKDILGASVARS